MSCLWITWIIIFALLLRKPMRRSMGKERVKEPVETLAPPGDALTRTVITLVLYCLVLTIPLVANAWFRSTYYRDRDTAFDIYGAWANCTLEEYLGGADPVSICGARPPDGVIFLCFFLVVWIILGLPIYLCIN